VQCASHNNNSNVASFNKLALVMPVHLTNNND